MIQCSLGLFVILISFKATLISAFEFPPYEIEVYTPKGFKISVPHTDGITLFAVHININKEMEYLEAGEIARDVVKRRGDRWVYEDKNLRLKVGDKLYFWLYLIYDRLGYRLDNEEYTVQNLVEKVQEPVIPTKPTITTRPSTKPTDSDIISTCESSYTTVSGKSVCKGSVLFLEEFFNDAGLGLNNNWTSEIQIPRTPETYFIVIDNTNRQVENGFLAIKPSLLEKVHSESFIRDGHLRLKGCTAESRSNCEARGFTWNIIPPVLTSRINTKNSFNFKYGIVEIRAKLPKGDWIVPELWLVGRNYGPNSGRIILGKSLGNEDLKLRDENIGGQILGLGVTTNETNGIFYTKTLNKLWSDDFHTYKIEWTPGYIVFKVDEVEVAKLDPKGKLFKDMGGSNLAPFDTEFYISLGVHVGGLVDFPDNCINRGKPKPWLDAELRNLIKFWQGREQWYQTWGSHSKLLVDYVKVTAL